MSMSFRASGGGLREMYRAVLPKNESWQRIPVLVFSIFSV